MKHLIATTVIVLFLFSCQKEVNVPISNYSNSSNLFFQNVKEKLKDSLSAFDYGSMDTTRLYKSKDAQSDGCFVRIALQDKNIATDFILLKTDSLGNIRQGKIIHVDKLGKGKRDNLLFQGQFIISSLDRTQALTKEVVNGRWKKQSDPASLLEEPAGEQDLPDVVVTSYSTDGSSGGDWYWYGGFYDDYSGGGGGYTYGYSDGGGSSTATNQDETIEVEVESDNRVPIKVEDYIKCFSTVPDAGATYQICIYSDIPVNNDPSVMFDYNTVSPGHSFIQLRKSSGTHSIQQSFGFYPSTSWQVLGKYPSDSKIVDNGGHRFDASLTQTLTSNQFAATIDRLISLETTDYDIMNWNCTDFALSVFNASTYNPLTIPQYITEGSGEAMNTPQGLYTEIRLLQASGNTTHGIPSAPKVEQEAGTSHGSCGE